MAKDDSKIINKEYGRKPYMSQDYDELMRKTTNKSMWDQEVSKHSEFEKPYEEGDYSDMQHDWPNFSGINTGDPSWDFPWNTGGPAPDATIPPGGGGISFACCLLACDKSNPIPGDIVKVFMHEWCWSYDIRGVKLIDDPIVSWALDSGFSDTSVGTIIEQSNAECKIQISNDSGYGDHLKVTATTRSGSTCFKTLDIDIASGCGGGKISYTTNQMSINEQQTLTVDNPNPYTTYDWVVASGGGNLSVAQGLTTVYTAPASNANCAENPMIELSSYGTVCDTLEIAINEWEGADEAGSLIYNLACHPNRDYHVCFCTRDVQYIDCSGTVTRISSVLHCTKGGQYVGPYFWVLCGSYPDCGDGQDCIDGCEYSGNWEDKRTSEMKAGGCCPPQLM